MKILRRRIIWMTTLTLLAAIPAIAEEGHSPAGSPEKLGRVHFPVSCSAAAQKEFDRAVALLHSFWYEKAEAAFSGIAETEPGCAMAHWGLAMSLYHPLWAPPSPAELEKGRAAAQKAVAAKTRSPLEKDYIAAIEAFYKDSDKRDHRTRALAYEKGMERVYQGHPGDPEAAVFYALALNGTALPTDKTYANQKTAAGILNAVLAKNPDHPGVTHYLIHSYDSPTLAGLALPAARSYAKIAPSVPHAQHMPSHIFTRMGLWQESIASNVASASAAKERVSQKMPGAGSFEQLHALDYLMYAYLQGAQDQKAKRLLDEIRTLETVDNENFAAAYALGAIPARFALERQQWAEAASLSLHPEGFPWDRFRYSEAVTAFARALGSARSGNPAGAKRDIETLESIHKALLEAKDVYWAGQVEVQRQAASAWLLNAEGREEEAVKLMRSAADLEDSAEKHPVTPGPVLPARELLGDLLLKNQKPAEALKEFEAALNSAPNRFHGLYGAARAAELAGDREKAETFYAKVLSLSERAETERPEIVKAKAFLARK